MPNYIIRMSLGAVEWSNANYSEPGHEFIVFLLHDNCMRSRITAGGVHIQFSVNASIAPAHHFNSGPGTLTSRIQLPAMKIPIAQCAREPMRLRE